MLAYTSHTDVAKAPASYASRSHRGTDAGASSKARYFATVAAPALAGQAAPGRGLAHAAVGM